jgi:hypothetical protein
MEPGASHFYIVLGGIEEALLQFFLSCFLDFPIGFCHNFQRKLSFLPSKAEHDQFSLHICTTDKNCPALAGAFTLPLSGQGFLSSFEEIL